MTTRRGFLKRAAAAGIVFCSCGMLDFANAQNGGRRLPVKVNGKRVRTIDVHAHCLFHESIALMGDQARNVIPPTKGAQEHFIAIETRLKGMDAMAIDMEVLSINPFWYGKDRDTAAKIVELNNEKLAELCAARPDRFAAFASLSLEYPDLALQQLETAIRKQGLKGAAIGGSVLGDDFSNPKYHPLWAKRRSSARCCSFIPRAPRRSRPASRETAGFRTPSAIRSTPPSPCNISSSKVRSTNFRA
jgi:predicted TIM-barrel fold metal-dependent hydrolase